MDTPGPDTAAPPGWYPDPLRRYEYRYHNGSVWTNDVSSAGRRFVDGVDGPTPPATHRQRSVTAALVLAIIGLCIAWMPVFFVAGAVCAVVSLVLAIRGHRQVPRDTRGFTSAAMLISGAALAVCGVGIWLTTWVVGLVRDYENPPATSVADLTCSVTDGALRVQAIVTNDDDRSSELRLVVATSREVADGEPVSVSFIGDVVVEVDEIEPGDSVAVDDDSTPVRGVDDGPLDCRLREITGPLPLGVDP